MDEIFKILACPVCKGNLEYNLEKKEILCMNCKRIYPIENGIPIMLEDKAKIK
ncbi:MAG: Trm112 family protein [Armatimonadetes bacterium]|nr:Trm112 family protein [Armatimonadota bacterium]